MQGTIDMKLMRYINLFGKISGVSTTNCFVYNNTIVFAVPKLLVSRAVGKDGANVRRIGEVFRRKIKVVPEANEEKMEEFISGIVSPFNFNKVDVKEGTVTLNAGRQNKAALIGRNRIREKELEDILKSFFNIKKLIII
jgi:NusA-like KH domain protein